MIRMGKSIRHKRVYDLLVVGGRVLMPCVVNLVLTAVVGESKVMLVPTNR